MSDHDDDDLRIANDPYDEDARFRVHLATAKAEAEQTEANERMHDEDLRFEQHCRCMADPYDTLEERFAIHVQSQQARKEDPYDEDRRFAAHMQQQEQQQEQQQQ